MKPLISVIITSYKREYSVFERAVKSAVSQTYTPTEIIVVDDNREDAEGEKYSQSLLTLRDAYPQVTVIRTENGKHGAQAARNTGIHNSKGEILAFLDDDDEWLPEKLSLQAEKLMADSDAGLCYAEGYRVNENYDPPMVNLIHGSDMRDSVTYGELLRGDCIGTTSQAMIRRSALEKVGEFDEDLPARQDYEMWIRIAKEFRIVSVREPVFKNYVSKGMSQITKNWDKCIEGHTKLYEKHRADIDKDRKARFNVRFYLAHYYFFKGDKAEGIKKYASAFFTAPEEFWNKGIIKLGQMRDAARAKKGKKN